MGYKPMGFGALPQAGVAHLSLVTHPRLLPSPGTLTHCHSCHHCPAAMLHIPLPSLWRSKHNSTVTGMGYGDPSLASGMLDSPALAREISSLKGDRGSQGRAGKGRGVEGATESQMYLPQVSGLLKPLLHCSITPLVSVALKPHVLNFIWSQPDLRLGGDLAEWDRHGFPVAVVGHVSAGTCQ